MKYLTLILVVAMTAALTACDTGGGAGSTSSAAPALLTPEVPPTSDAPPVSPAPSPSPSPSSQSVNVSVYTLTELRVAGAMNQGVGSSVPLYGMGAPGYIAPAHSFVIKGSCLTYNLNTYCWDNGVVSTAPYMDHDQFHNLVSYCAAGTCEFSFFGLMTPDNNVSSTGICIGNCADDVVTAPTKLIYSNNGTVLDSFNGHAINPALSIPDDVFTHGDPNQVTCTDDGTTLTCPDFTVTL